MARELPPDDGIPFGLALDVWARVEQIEELCKSVKRDTLRLELALTHARETSASGFRAHTKTAPRFPEPDPIAIAAESHGCYVPPEKVDEVERCGE